MPRWSGVLVEARVDKLLEKHALTLQDLQGPPGALEGRLVRETLSGELAGTLAALRSGIDGDYRRLAQAVEQVDPTLRRTLESARNAALAGTHDIEKKLVASLKRTNETLLGQIARARAAVFPTGRPQERVLTLASFSIRYGPALLDELATEVARWADAS